MKETWRITHVEGYQVSDRGRVRSVDRWVRAKASWRRPAHWRRYRGKMLRPGRFNSSGHVSVVLGGKGNPGVAVHTLVLAAFRGHMPAGREARHLNGKGGDNRLSNLLWGTYSENVQDAWDHGARG